jgi:hypothetical protein
MTERRARLLLAVLVVVVFGPFVQDLTAQPASRYALTAAIWERHSVNITGYPIDVDLAFGPHGSLRSDKAPGQPLLTVPLFAIARIAGTEPASHRRVEGNLGLWWLTLWSSVIPLAVLVALMHRVATSVGANAPVVGPLAIVFATTIAAFASQLFGHLLAATLLFGAWYVARDAPSQRVVPWATAGVLTGAALVTEYTTAVIGAVLACYVLLRAPRRLLAFAAGTVPGVALLLAYNQAAFGAPWRLSYGTKGESPGVSGVTLPRLHVVRDLLFDERGLLLFTPIVVIAAALAIWLALRPGPARVDAVVALACFGGYFLLQVGWGNAWGGDSPGPRYMIPAIPFLATPLAAGWAKLRTAARTATAWGAFWLAMPVLFGVLIPRDADAFDWWSVRLRDWELVPTTWTMAFGPAGWLFHGATVAAVGFGLARASRAAPTRADQASPAVSSPPEVLA